MHGLPCVETSPPASHLEIHHKAVGHVLEELGIDIFLLCICLVIRTGLLLECGMAIIEKAVFTQLSSIQFIKELATHVCIALGVRSS
jgi:hypothetical protein